MIQLIVGGCTGGAVAPRVCLKLDDGRSDTPPRIWLEKEFDRDRFGQLTTSFAVIDKDVAFLIDNGLGVQIAADAILQSGVKSVVMLQSHYHYDHIEGMHLNPMLYMPNGPLTHFVAPKLAGVDPKRFWTERLLNTAHWPITPKCSVQTISFEPGADLDIYGREVETLLQNHPGGSCGYRIPLSDGESIVIATDIELAGEVDQKNFAKFIYGSTYLVVDCQLRRSEYIGRVGVMGSRATPMVGWGHSTPEMIVSALEYCDAPPEFIFATHHDSRRNWDDIIEFNGEFDRALGDYITTEKGDPWSFLYEAQVIDLRSLLVHPV